MSKYYVVWRTKFPTKYRSYALALNGTSLGPTLLRYALPRLASASQCAYSACRPCISVLVSIRWNGVSHFIWHPAACVLTQYAVGTIPRFLQCDECGMVCRPFSLQRHPTCSMLFVNRYLCNLFFFQKCCVFRCHRRRKIPAELWYEVLRDGLLRLNDTF